MASKVKRKPARATRAKKAAPGRARAPRSRARSKTSRAPASRGKGTLSDRPLRSPRQPVLRLDWETLCSSENGRTFEDLGLDLFTERYGDDHFIPNAERTGPDGGSDGLLEAALDDIAGPWKIACAVRKSFSDAKKKVVQENQKACAAGHRGLFFITSYDATPEQVITLQKLARTGLKGSKVWSRRMISRFLRDHAWLRQLYFGHDIVPGFVPVNHPTELDDQNQPDVEFVGREREADLLRRHLEGVGSMVVVEAPGGSGKSRFLRALPELMRGGPRRRSIWLRRPGIGTISESIRSGLPARRPMLLVLDDAGQALAEVDELARMSTDGNLDVQVVFASRTADHDALLARLGGLRSEVTWIDLEPLSFEDCTRLVIEDCETLDHETARKLARAFGTNLFLLRAAAQLIKRGQSPADVVDDAHLRSLVAQRFIAEAEQRLYPHVDPGDVRALLAELSLNVPVPFNQASDDLALAALHRAGLLRRAGNTLRFRRDVEGDILLAYLLSSPTYQVTVESLISPALHDGTFQRQLRNLAAAGRGSASEIVTRIVRSWRSDPALLDSPARCLELLPYCARAAPEEVTALCIQVAFSTALSSDDVGPIILAVGLDDAARALSLAGELAAAGCSRGRFSNYNAHGLASRLLNPYFHGPDELRAACGVLEGWLRSSHLGARSELTASALKALFSTVARWNTSDAVSVTLHEKELPAAPLLLELRRTAVQLLGEMLQHPDRTARLHAIEVLKSHGSPNIGRVSTSAFDQAAASEFEALSQVLDERLRTEEDVEIRFGIYVALAERWAAGWPGSDTAARLLQGRPTDPVLRAFHYASNRTRWFYSFDEAFAQATAATSDRWSWWVNSFMLGRAREGEVERLVDDLCRHCNSVDGLISCTTALLSAANPAWILDPWCRRSPALFESARKNLTDLRTGALLDEVLRRHRYSIDPSAALKDLYALPRPLTAAAVDGVLGAGRSAVEQALEEARFLASQEDVAVRRRALGRIEDRSDVPAAEVLDVLEDALRDGDWHGEWEAIWAMLKAPDRAALLSQRSNLRVQIAARFLERTDASLGHGWYEARVLELLYGADDSARLELLGRLLAQGTYRAAHTVRMIVRPLFDDLSHFTLLVRALVQWVEELEIGIGVVDGLLSDIRHEGLPEGAIAVISGLCSSTEASARSVGLVLLSRVQSPEACVQIAEVAIDPQDELQELALSSLWSYRRPRGAYKRSIGEPAPALLSLREALRGALPLASRSARRLIGEVLQAVQQELDADARSDEEELEPR